MDALLRFNPQPKPKKRGRKPRTRLPRTAADPADFDKAALRAIYGEYPQCLVVTSQKAQDPHHIFQRGPKQHRKLFSSVFNAAPLSRDVHDHCPFLTNPNFQAILFQCAVDHVNLAVAKGEYTVTENDLSFLDYLRTA